jgi:hypothetical protein
VECRPPRSILFYSQLSPIYPLAPPPASITRHLPHEGGGFLRLASARNESLQHAKKNVRHLAAECDREKLHCPAEIRHKKVPLSCRRASSRLKNVRPLHVWGDDAIVSGPVSRFDRRLRRLGGAAR